MKFKAEAIKLSEGELLKNASDFRRQITKFRLEKFVGRNRNVRNVFILRKKLAIVNTLLNTKKTATA